MAHSYRDLDTRLVHAGEPRPRILGAVAFPVFQSANYVDGDVDSEVEDYHQIRYIRLNNTPNHQVLHEKLRSLESAEAGLVTASGMAAITTTLLAMVESGQHLLVQDTLYGGTLDFLTQDIRKLGIDFDFVDADDPDSWKKKLRPTTRAFYAESLTNPLLQVGDLEGIVAFARAHGLVSIIDNTFPSPVNFRAVERGFDLSLHSGTKYLNGHSDIVCGAVLGAASLVDKVKKKLDHLGGSLDPHACFLLQRGLKTLALRVARQNQSAMAVASLLAAHPAIARVNYPGLATHPQHARAKELFDGFSGMLSFEPRDGIESAKRMIQALKLPIYAPSLGGVESLVTFPARTSHKGLDPAARRALGIGDALVRVSIGIESTADLVEDFRQALDAASRG